MRLRLSISGASIALASALCASVAVADGYSRPGTTYTAPPILSWTGFYVGAHLGGAWSDVEWANVTLTDERVTNDSSGFFGGRSDGLQSAIRQYRPRGGNEPEWWQPER